MAFCEIDRKEGSDSSVFKSFIDGRRMLNYIENINTPFPSQVWYGGIIFEAIEVQKS